MARPRFPEAEFIELFESIGPEQMATKFGMNVRGIYQRRENLEIKHGRQITAPDNGGNRRTRSNIKHDARQHLAVKDGVVLIGSDAHYWPGIVTTAHRAFVHMAKELNPRAIIMNGDVFDGAKVSRHPSIGWEDKPDVIEEIDACTERLSEIEEAAPKATRVWTLGNHDARFESRLANVAPEYARVHGVHLKDHFPWWQPCWSVWINDDVVVKHRFKGGIHATHNNALWAGKTVVTGHLHSLKVTPLNDYNGSRWGVDCGTLAEVGGPQFIDYLEDNPVNWRAGFVVLTFHKGRLLWPDVCHVIGDREISFQGKVVRV